MTEQAKILIVDDVMDNIALATMILEDDYETKGVQSGQECLEIVESYQPDVILLDVNMPEMDGYTVCRQLKQSPTTGMIPVVFLSALDLPEQRLEGFEAGGDDYLVKPIDDEQLLHKIAQTLEHRLENKSLQKQATEAMSAAMEAMTTSSELGQLIQFTKTCADLKTVSEVADQLFQVTRSYGLQCCAMIKLGGSPQFYGCEAGTLESRVLEKCHDSDKILDFGSRSVFSEGCISILAKNMPLDEPVRYGRLKDNLAVLSSLADSQIKTLNMEATMNQQRRQIIEDLIRISEQQMVEAKDKAEKHETEIRRIMESMISALEEKLLFLGLEEDQEKALINLANSTSEKLESIDSFSGVMEKTLGDILDGLYNLLNR